MSSAAPALSAPARRDLLLAVGLIVLAVCLAYAGTLNGPFIFDDAVAIRDNASLHHLGTALTPPDDGSPVSGRPLANLSFALNYAVGGLGVCGYHVFNLAIHLTNALLLLALARRTLQCLGGELARAALPLATAIALLWALHPLQTESVTYLAQRTESLAALFYLLMLYACARHAEKSAASSFALWSIVAVIVCAAGMATKETAVTAPVLALLYDRTFFAGTFHGAWRARRGLYLALASTWLVQIGLLVTAGGTRGATAGFALGITPWTYALTQCRAIMQYIGLTLWPGALVLDYGQGVASGLTEVIPQAFAVVALFATTIYALARRPVLGFFGAAFFLLLAPSSSFVPVVTQTMAEHRMYLPLAALMAGAVVAVYHVGSRASLVGCGVITLAFGSATLARNRVYQSAVAIWSDTTTKAPGNARAWYSLGFARIEAGDLKGAADALARSDALAPGNSETLVARANVLAQIGATEQALALYRAGLEKYPAGFPGSYDALHNFGVLLTSSGRAAEAIGSLQSALALRPTDPESHLALANALRAADRLTESIPHFEAALGSSQTELAARTGLGNTLTQLGRTDEALAVLRTGLAHFPADSALHLNLGLTYLATRRIDDAIVAFTAWLKADPASAAAHENLAFALVAAGRFTDAVPHYEAALRQTPSADTYADFGQLYLRLGRLAEARAQFEAALRLDPNHAAARAQIARLPPNS